MPQITYLTGNETLIDQIKPLWEQLNDHHQEVSRNFSDWKPNFTFELRKQFLFQKAAQLMIRIDLACDQQSQQNIGYCLSTVNDTPTGSVGEIESIYLVPKYRGLGIAKKFMTEALAWMDGLKVQRRILGVAVGNEAVFSFYEQFNFLPRTVIFEQKRELTKA